MPTKEKTELHKVIGRIGGLKSVKIRGLLTAKEFRKSYLELIRSYKLKKNIYEKSKKF